MHELVRKGKARQIGEVSGPSTNKEVLCQLTRCSMRCLGLSNFNILKTKRIIEETGIIPAANQVEMNP